MPTLPDFRLETFFSRWEFAARHHLTASDAQTMSLAELLDLADDDSRARWEGLTLGYTETYGMPELRSAIAATYDGLDAADVLCFAGAEEAIYLAMHVLLDAGDHAVVLTPNYQAAETIPLSIAEVTGVALRPEDGWALDVDAIAKALRPNTRLVSVNFPNNPTGAVPDPDAWRALVALCDERGIRLFSDEVYRGLERDRPPLPQAAELSDSAVSLNVMSKAYGLPGLRIGWIACRDRELLGRLERAKHYTSICNSAPSEVLALMALRAGERILTRNRAIIAANLPSFDAFFARFPDLFAWSPPQGGCVAYPRYLGEDGVEEMCRSLVEEEGVLLLPASIYRSELTPVPGDRFRVGVGRHGPQEALDLWAAWLDRRLARPADPT
ncbi:aminotransferase class I/II-fold pyridoxal phosphate-dependent enzyme [Phytomonospora endophytica]|uniref:Aspartate/methionine/tyrosine aminotransferase n=1 Tax=Phytomonospora endophytica TaxID=714109 RepID=A0A841FZH8_9ACTN|nr:pyridoxal phosphate-dependent aminotransferase [Phytomonospora endophytica]MBB6038932.1 aspartate/methionine/tyrosine aminotransferase [Phytomonospora endophytica]GIG67966.1 aminotransferase [Phytomonospora endophytica]